MLQNVRQYLDVKLKNKKHEAYITCIFKSFSYILRQSYSYQCHEQKHTSAVQVTQLFTKTVAGWFCIFDLQITHLKGLLLNELYNTTYIETA